ncbi:MAG: potassium transporter TrkG [Anaerovoracaceae bacterium]
MLFWKSFTHWIGGMGILVFAIALMPSLGRSGQNVAVSEAPGLSLDKITPEMSDTAKSLYIIYLIFTVVETILLMLGGIDHDALIHTFGSVGTGGLSTYNDSVGHFDSLYINVVITVFMILCGINFNLFFMSFRNGIRTL